MVTLKVWKYTFWNVSIVWTVYRDRHWHETTQNVATGVLGVYSKPSTKVYYPGTHCNMPSCDWDLNLFLIWLHWVLVSHFLTFAVWLTLVHTSFVNNDSATKKVSLSLWYWFRRQLQMPKFLASAVLWIVCATLCNSYGSEICGGIFGIWYHD
jgi:hypothetical protein